MIYAIVSLDLANAKEERTDFNNYLTTKKWDKLGKVDTVWAVKYPSATELSFDVLVADIRADLEGAAKELELEKVTYVAQIGNTRAIGRYIVRERGVYKYGEFDPYIKEQ